MKRPFGGKWVGGAILAIAFLALSACEGESATGDEDGDGDGDGDDDPSEYCQRIGGKLQSCGMGALLADLDDCEEPEDEEDRCTTECLIDASCDDIRTLVCLGDLTASLEACVLGCVPSFTCGDGVIIGEASVCDGYMDCADGSDETQNCPTCSDGTPLPSYAMCDGFSHCTDGRDEAACPTFRCGSGETVPEDFECDYFPDCLDGSDEHAGCPGAFVCGSGEVVPGEFECDGFPDCLDGSDEPASCPPTPTEEICGT
jgi:hypothetical protein